MRNATCVAHKFHSSGPTVYSPCCDNIKPGNSPQVFRITPIPYGNRKYGSLSKFRAANMLTGTIHGFSTNTDFGTIVRIFVRRGGVLQFLLGGRGTLRFIYALITVFQILSVTVSDRIARS